MLFVATVLNINDISSAPLFVKEELREAVRMTNATWKEETEQLFSNSSVTA